jgi:hypothetical protein
MALHMSWPGGTGDNQIDPTGEKEKYIAITAIIIAVIVVGVVAYKFLSH